MLVYITKSQLSFNIKNRLKFYFETDVNFLNINSLLTVINEDIVRTLDVTYLNIAFNCWLSVKR